MRNVHFNTEYVVLFRNPRDFGQLEPKHSKALVDAYMDATSRPYSHLLVDLKPHTPDAFSTAGSKDGVRDWSCTDMSDAEARRPLLVRARAPLRGNILSKLHFNNKK